MILQRLKEPPKVRYAMKTVHIQSWNDHLILEEYNLEEDEASRPLVYIPEQENKASSTTEKIFKVVVPAGHLEKGAFVLVDFYNPLPKVDDRRLFSAPLKAVIATLFFESDDHSFSEDDDLPF